MENRTTPENIENLKNMEIFVFGSNLSGIHGAGAAKLAFNKGWTTWGLGFGLCINTESHFLHGSFAIPTKGYEIEEIPLSLIEYHVKNFIKQTKLHPNYKFLVTEIGCGLAGWKPKDIAPFFKETINLENIYLPKRFWDILNK